MKREKILTHLRAGCYSFPSGTGREKRVKMCEPPVAFLIIKFYIFSRIQQSYAQNKKSPDKALIEA